MPGAVSSARVGGKYEVPGRTLTGSSRAYYFFGVGPTGEHSLNAALGDAKSQTRPDSPANILVDRKLTCFPLCGFSIFMRIDTMLYRTIVRNIKEEGVPVMAQDNAGGAPKEPAPPLPPPENKGEPRAVSFKGLKSGTILEIAFKSAVMGGKNGTDGRYEFLSEEKTGCGWLKPAGGGFFSKTIRCPGAIESLKVVQ